MEVTIEYKEKKTNNFWFLSADCERSWYAVGRKLHGGPTPEWLLRVYHYFNRGLYEALEIPEGISEEEEEDLSYQMHRILSSGLILKNPGLSQIMLAEYTGSPTISEILRNHLSDDKVKGRYLRYFWKESKENRYSAIEYFQRVILGTPATDSTLVLFRQMGKAFFDRCVIGSMYIDPGFQSTSFDYKMSLEFSGAEGILLRIIVPPGYHVLPDVNASKIFESTLSSTYDPDIEERFTGLSDNAHVAEALNYVLASKEVVLPAFSKLLVLEKGEYSLCTKLGDILENLTVYMVTCEYQGTVTDRPITGYAEAIKVPSCWTYVKEQKYASIHAYSIPG